MPIWNGLVQNPILNLIDIYQFWRLINEYIITNYDYVKLIYKMLMWCYIASYAFWKVPHLMWTINFEKKSMILHD
jgi:hypothetical protein